MKLTVTEDDGTVVFTVHIPDRDSREDQQWQQRVSQAAAFQQGASVHPIRPVGGEEQQTAPPGDPDAPPEAHSRWTNSAAPWREQPGAPAVVACPDSGLAWADRCKELGSHTHYADGSVSSAWVNG